MCQLLQGGRGSGRNGTEIKNVFKLASLLARRGASGSVTLAGVALSPSSSLESSPLLGDSLLLLQGVAVAVVAVPAAAVAATAACWPNSVLLFLLLPRSISLICVICGSACDIVAAGAKYADRGTSLASPTQLPSATGCVSGRAKVRHAAPIHALLLLLPFPRSLSISHSSPLCYALSLTRLFFIVAIALRVPCLHGGKRASLRPRAARWPYTASVSRITYYFGVCTTNEAPPNRCSHTDIDTHTHTHTHMQSS